LEAADLPLLGVLGAQLAVVFADLHRNHGVSLRTGVALTEIRTDHTGAAAGVRLADGTTIDATAVVVGIGVTPRIELARNAGLDVGNGVLVNAALLSSDPRISAVGDIASHAHPVLGGRVRVEHWATALNQPATAAAALLGDDVQYRALPYFFTDQYELGMEYIGHAPPGSYARIVTRGDVRSREFVAFWLDDGDRIKAAMNVNVWDVPDAVRPLLESGTPVEINRLSDAGVPLSDVTVRSRS
jgi:NADPH-dependent 2,4-dienoyl-CoA reductase/sulfur reductase-like enzyme